MLWRRNSDRRRSAVALFQPVLAHYRVDLLNELGRRLDGRVTLFTEAPDPSSALLDGSHSILLPMSNSHTYRLGPLWFVPQALRATGTGRWSAVVLSWNVRQVELLPALLFGRLTRTPVILWGHGLGRSGSTVAWLLRAMQARLAATIVVYSHAGAQEVRRIAGRTPVVVAPNTTGRPSPTREDDLQSLTRTVGYVGRLDRRKHLDRLLDAVAELRPRGLTLNVSFLGDGPDAERLERHSRSLGLADRAFFREATGDWGQVKAHLQSLDVVVFPEAGGLGVVDAFAAARGVVILDSRTSNGPEAENVIDRITGVRYDGPTARSLANVLELLYRDESLVMSCSRNAAVHYRDSLNMDAAVEPFRQVIAPLLVAQTDRKPR